MLERIKRLHEKGYSAKEISDLVDLEPSVVESILNEELYTVNQTSIKKFYELVDMDNELECLLDDVANSSVSYSTKHNAVMIAGDIVNVRISKNGSLYFMLKGLYLKGSLRNKVMKLIIENQMEEVKELAELPKYIVKLMKSKFSGKEYIVWFNKSEEPIIAMLKEQGLQRLENQMKEIEYKALKEELNYANKINKEPIYNDAYEDLVYEGQVEEFQNQVAEMNEFLQVLYNIRTSKRALHPEELLLLKEIQSELNNIIGE